MPNKLLTNDWLESGKKHLEVAEILFKNAKDKRQKGKGKRIKRLLRFARNDSAGNQVRI